MEMTELELKKVRGYLVEARKWLNSARFAGKTSGQHIAEADSWVNDAMLALTEIEKRGSEVTREQQIREARIKWGFCPDCGHNMEHPITVSTHLSPRAVGAAIIIPNSNGQSGVDIVYPCPKC